MAASAFREHNFASDGVANRYMSLGYSAKVLDFFYKDDTGRKANLMERAQEITRSITLDTSELLEAALDIAAHIDLADHDRIARQTALLGLRVAASDRIWYAAMDALEKDMARFARGEAQAGRKVASRTAKVAQSAAVAGWLALWVSGGASCGRTSDPLPPPNHGRDAGKSDVFGTPDGPLVVDALPPPQDARDALRDGPLVVDALPPDSGARNDTPVFDPLPPDANPRDVGTDGPPIDTGAVDVRDATKEGPMVVDMVPPPSDARDLPRESPLFEVDPLPPDSGARDAAKDVRDAGTNEPPFMVDPVVDARLGLQVPLDLPGGPESATREHWANTAPVRMKRSQDLPLCLCPEVRLRGEWKEGKVLARLSGVSGTFGLRWQAQGQVEGEGREILWTPSSDEDQLDVAVRTLDGVAVTSLRLGQTRGKRQA